MAHDRCSVRDPTCESTPSLLSARGVADITLGSEPVSCVVSESLAVDLRAITGNHASGRFPVSAPPQSVPCGHGVYGGASQQISDLQSCSGRYISEYSSELPAEDPSLCSGPSPGVTEESLQGAPSPGSAVSNSSLRPSDVPSGSPIRSSPPASSASSRSPACRKTRRRGLGSPTQTLFDEDTEEIELLMRGLFAFAGHIASALGGPLTGKHGLQSGDKEKGGWVAARESLPSITLLRFHASAASTGSVLSRRFSPGISLSPLCEAGNLASHGAEKPVEEFSGLPERRASEHEPGPEAMSSPAHAFHSGEGAATQQSVQTFPGFAPELQLEIVQLLVRLVGEPLSSSLLSGHGDSRSSPRRRPGTEEAEGRHCRLHHTKRNRLVETQLEELRREQEQEGGGSEPEDEDHGSPQSISSSSSDDSLDGDAEHEDEERIRREQKKHADHLQGPLGGSISFEESRFAEHTPEEGGRRRFSVFSPRSKKPGRTFRVGDTAKIQKILVSARARRKRLLLAEWQKQKFETRLFRRLSRVYQFFCRVRNSATAFSAFLLLLLATPGDNDDMLLLVLAACWRLCDQCEAAAVAADAAEARNFALAEAAEAASGPRSCARSRSRLRPDRESNDRSPESRPAISGVLSESGAEFSLGGIHTSAVTVPPLARGQREENAGEQGGDTGVVFHPGRSVTGEVCECCPLALLDRAECVEYVRGFIASLLPTLLWTYTSRCLLPPHQLCVLHNLLPALDALHFSPVHSSVADGKIGSTECVWVSGLDKVVASSSFLSDLPDNVSGIEALLLLFAATPSPLASSAIADATPGKALNLASGGDMPLFLAPGPPMVSTGSAAAALSPHIILPSGSADGDERLGNLSSCASAVAGITSTVTGSGSGGLGVVCPWILPPHNQPVHAYSHRGRPNYPQERTSFQGTGGDTSCPFANVVGLDSEASTAAVIASQEAAYADFLRILTGRWDFATKRENASWVFRGVAHATATHTTAGLHAASAPQPFMSKAKALTSSPGGTGEESRGSDGGGGPAGLHGGPTREGLAAGAVHASTHAVSPKDPLANAGAGGGGAHAREACLDTSRDSARGRESDIPTKGGSGSSSNGGRVVLIRNGIAPPLARMTAARQQDLLLRCLATFSFYSGVCAAVESRARSRLLRKSGVQADTWARLLAHSVLKQGKGGLGEPDRMVSREESGGKCSARENREYFSSSFTTDAHLQLEIAVAQTENKVLLTPDEHVGLLSAAFLASLSRSDAFEPISMAHVLPQPLVALLHKVEVNDDRVFTVHKDASVRGGMDAAACIAACTCSPCKFRDRYISSIPEDSSQTSGASELRATHQASGTCKSANTRSLNDLIAYALYGDDGVTFPQATASQHRTPEVGLPEKSSFPLVGNGSTVDKLLQSTVDPWSTGRIRAPVSDALLLQAASTTGRLLFDLTRKHLAVSYNCLTKRAWRTAARPAYEAGRMVDTEEIDEEAKEEGGYWAEVLNLALRHQHRMLFLLCEAMRLAAQPSQGEPGVPSQGNLSPAASRQELQERELDLCKSGGKEDREVDYEVACVDLTDQEFLLMLLIHQTNHFRCRCRGSRDEKSCDLATALAKRHFLRNFGECMPGMNTNETECREEGHDSALRVPSKGWDGDKPDGRREELKGEMGDGSAKQRGDNVLGFDDRECFPCEAWPWIRKQLLARHLRNVLKTGQQRAEAEMLLRSYWVFTALRHTLR